MIRVILADDHVLVRQGIRQFLDAAEDITVIDEAGDGVAAIAAVARYVPDVAILDIRMPHTNGIEATQQIKRDHPGVRVLILTAYDDDPYIYALLRAGADGYVLKTAESAALIKAVHDVCAGVTALSPEIATKVVRQITSNKPTGAAEQVEPLTDRELEVLQLTAVGATNREIGRDLHISHRTVQGHLANIYGKLGVSGRTEAVTEALKRGWIIL